LNERLLSHHLGGDLLNLGSELSLSGLVSLSLGSALGYRGPGLFLPGEFAVIDLRYWALVLQKIFSHTYFT